MKTGTLWHLIWLWSLLAVGAVAQQTPASGPEEAEAAATPAAEDIQPDKAQAYYHYALGHLYQERGALFHRADLLSKAVDELRLALRYDPGSSFLSRELADLYAATGRWVNALSEAEEAVERNPDDDAARQLLVRLYARLLTGEQAQRAPSDLQQRAIRLLQEITARNPNEVDAYLVLAQVYRAMSQTAEAEETLRKALALQPDSHDANTNLALLYVDIGDYRAAIDLLNRLLEEDPDPRLLGTLAYAYEQVRDYDAAAQAYSRALERDPDNWAIRKTLGQNYLLSEKYDQAVEQFQAVIHANPRDAEAYLRLSQVFRLQQKFTEARETLETALELAPGNLDVQYNQVLLAEMEGNAGDAIDITRKILDSTAKPDPDSYTGQEKNNRSIFLEKLGSLYRLQGDFQGAEETYRQMIEMGDDLAIRGEARLIETFQDSREYDKALKASEAAVKNYPDSRELKLARASLLASTGDVSKGVALVRSLLQDTPEDRGIWLALAQVHLRARQFDEAREAAGKARELTRSDEELEYIHFLNGSIWERQKNFERAEEEFRKVLDLNPDSSMTLNYLGYMLADQGIRLEESVGYLEKAVKMDPTNGAYLDSLGWAYYQQNELELAERYLKKAVERVPGDPTIQSHLGDLYYKMGRLREAQAEWQEALREWSRMPKNEREPEEIARTEKKLKEALTKLAQENNESRR